MRLIISKSDVRHKKAERLKLKVRDQVLKMITV